MNISISCGTTLRSVLCSLIFFGASAILQPANAQSAVTAVFTHPQNATTATAYSGTGATGNAASGLTGNTYTYNFGTNVVASNNNIILDSFTALALNYHYQPAIMSVVFRRVDNASVTGLRKSLWFEQDGSTVNPGGTVGLYPDYEDSLERLFTKRIFNIGIDNVFQNATTTNNNNIEREDVIFHGGVKASDNTKAGFVVFDRGNAGGHDPFYIAAIKTLDVAGNPSAYYPAVLVSSGNYGNIGNSLAYIILRKNPADASLLMMNNSTAQNRDGVFLRFLDLGVPVNTAIYGYSLFSTDVTVSPVIKMVNYNTAADFPTTSDLGSGGLDQLAITGLWVTNSSYILLSENVEGFQATLMNDKVKLSWQQSAANNQETTLIERSTDGLSYTPLLCFTAPAPGPQTVFDAHPLPGTSYYRLKLTNTNGTVAAYSAVSEISNAATIPLSLSVYPNPVKNKQLYINARGLIQGAFDLRLFDMRGHLVFRQSLNGGPFAQKQISLPGNLAPGIYAVRLADNNGNKVFEGKIAVE